MTHLTSLRAAVTLGVVALSLRHVASGDAQAPATITVSRNVQVSAARPASPFNEVVVAAHPRDPSRLMACAMLEPGANRSVKSAAWVSTDSGRIIGTNISPPGVVRSTDPAGHSRIRFQMPHLALNQGRYRVGVYLLCHQARYVYDWSDPHAHINLQHEGAHQGPWLMPGQWQC